VKKHKSLPPRRDSRITSQYIPADGSVVISVARGWTGSGEVLYRLEAEKIAGALEDRKELAVIVNNLGLLLLAQLTGFNLADSLDKLPAAMAEWAHIDVKSLKQDDAQEALKIAQARLREMHSGHGVGDANDGPGDWSDCPCNGGTDQTICASAGCGFCHASEAMRDPDAQVHAQEKVAVESGWVEL
jgi:hypothetical protein